MTSHNTKAKESPKNTLPSCCPQSATTPLDQDRLRIALSQYENTVIDRARPGVLASRRACLDAHEWARIGPESPLLTKRQMNIIYDELADRIVG